MSDKITNMNNEVPELEESTDKDKINTKKKQRAIIIVFASMCII